MARRAWGSGSLYRRTSDGRWVGRVSDGQGGHRYVTGPGTKAGKDSVRSRLRELSRSSRTARSRERTADVLGRWFAQARLRARTRAGYQSVLTHHILPAIGDVPIADLGVEHIESMVRGILAKKGRGDTPRLSPQTAKHALKITRVGLAAAVRWGIVERNPAALVKAPTVTRKPLTALTAEQTRTFLAATRGEPLWPLWALAMTTGMRQSELLGLRWQDVSSDAISVNVSLRRIDRDTWALEEPKTEKSRRVLPLTPLGIEALAKQKEQATSALWVFARPDGRPLERTRVTVLFQRALVAHGLPKIRFHDARHGAAAMMLDMLGGDIRAVSAYLGHSTIATTVDIYGGKADEARKRAMEAMGRALEGKG